MPDKASFNTVLKNIFAKRKDLTTITNALRLVTGQGDGLDGLILEQYDQHFVAQIFDPQWLGKSSMLIETLQKQFSPQYLIIKDRTSSASSIPDAIKTHVVINRGQGSKAVVQEYGIKFCVDLNDGLNSGLFLDMRGNRHQLAEQLKGKRLLNCFSYTCSFGVHARMNEASDVVNVDVSAKILERGRYNYELNGIVPSENEFIRADAAAYLERAVKKDNRFDAIVLDPPSFARADKKVFQIKRDLPALLWNAVKVLNPGGILFVSTNFNAIGYKDVEAMMHKAANGRRVKNAMPIGQDKDFPGTNTFKESYLVGIWARFL